MHLFLIRHGRSVHSDKRLVAGRRGCQGLTAAGVEQAQRLRDRLHQTGEWGNVNQFITSPILRAVQTAEILQPSIFHVNLTKDENFEELRPGQADGLTWEAFRERFGWFDMTVESERPFAPEGESWLAFSKRVTLTLDQLAEQYADQTVAVVTHGGFIAASLVVKFNIPRPGTETHLHAENTSITEWRVKNGRWTLLRFSDTAHLQSQH